MSLVVITLEVFSETIYQHGYGTISFLVLNKNCGNCKRNHILRNTLNTCRYEKKISRNFIFNFFLITFVTTYESVTVASWVEKRQNLCMYVHISISTYTCSSQLIYLRYLFPSLLLPI